MNPTMRCLLSAVLSLGAILATPSRALETVDVTLTETARYFRLDGVVEAVNRSTIAAQTSAQITEVLFDVDDFVEKGAVIVVLRNTEQKAGVEQASANLRAARARLTEAQSEHKRIADLFDRQLVSRQDMDRVSAALKTARAGFEAAQATVNQAGQQLEYTRVTAPYSGIVTERHVEVGEVAQPGTPLMSGISLEQLRVSVEIPQSIVNLVRQHQSATVELPDGQQVEASSVTVFPVAEAGSGSFTTRLGLPSGLSGVFPGMYVKTSFVTGREDVLTVPAQSVAVRSEVTGIYVENADGSISFRHIRPGRTFADGRMTLLAGADAGEKVVLDPAQAVALLKSGNGDNGD